LPLYFSFTHPQCLQHRIKAEEQVTSKRTAVPLTTAMPRNEKSDAEWKARLTRGLKARNLNTQVGIVAVPEGKQDTVCPSNSVWMLSTNKKPAWGTSSLPRVNDSPQAVWEANGGKKTTWNTFLKEIDLDESH